MLLTLVGQCSLLAHAQASRCDLVHQPRALRPQGVDDTDLLTQFLDLCHQTINSHLSVVGQRLGASARRNCFLELHLEAIVLHGELRRLFLSIQTIISPRPHLEIVVPLQPPKLLTATERTQGIEIA